MLERCIPSRKNLMMPSEVCSCVSPSARLKRQLVPVAIHCVLALASASLAGAGEYYVDAAATSAGNGALNNPFRTVQQAASVMEAGDVCILRKGTYRETVRPARSGTADRPLVFRPWPGESVVISGCEPVTAWRKSEGSIYRAPVAMKLGHENQVFADGKMLVEARWPNSGQSIPRGLLEFDTARMGSGTTRTKIVDDDLPELDQSGAQVWVSSHKRWFCWTGRVQGSGPGHLSIEDNSDSRGNHVCRQDGRYYVFGALPLLDQEDEWYYDAAAGELCLWSLSQDAPAKVEVKTRLWAFDLTGRENIRIEGLQLFGASILTDDDSVGITLDGIRAEYVCHSNRATEQYRSQARTGIELRGQRHTIRNSEIAYSSGNCIALYGRDCQVINCFIHDGNYIGSYASPVSFGRGGSGNVVSHSTITRAGRTTVGVVGFYRSLLQYNDISYAGYLTDDLGLTYGNGVEGGNSEVRYNWLHDNIADRHNMGLYFDHGCKNVIFHHNVIWNVEHPGMINNQYANYLFYYNNTVCDGRPSYQSAWAAGQAKDLYGCRLVNNLGTSGTKVRGEGLVTGSNTWDYTGLDERRLPAQGSEPVDSGQVVPTITDGHIGPNPDRGAYELGTALWRAGHDFADPPTAINTTRCEPPDRNRIRNAAFYNGSSEAWTTFGSEVRVVSDFHSQWANDAKTMMGGYSAEIGAGSGGLVQTVEGLEPNTTYELMAMFRVPDGEAARLTVKGHGPPPQHSAPVTSGAPRWTRSTLRFTTGSQNTSATVVLEKHSAGPGKIYIDDPGLQLVKAD